MPIVMTTESAAHAKRLAMMTFSPSRRFVLLSENPSGGPGGRGPATGGPPTWSMLTICLFLAHGIDARNPTEREPA